MSTESALKAWVTRRLKAAAIQREAKRLAKKRTQAALKAWKTRRKNASL